MSVCTLPADARVADFLRYWAESLAKRGLRTDQITLRMTRAEIGNYLGMTLETVSRALSKLAREQGDRVRREGPARRPHPRRRRADRVRAALPGAGAGNAAVAGDAAGAASKAGHRRHQDVAGAAHRLDDLRVLRRRPRASCAGGRPARRSCGRRAPPRGRASARAGSRATARGPGGARNAHSRSNSPRRQRRLGACGSISRRAAVSSSQPAKRSRVRSRRRRVRRRRPSARGGAARP